MSDVQKTKEKTPPCPMCAAASELKEVLKGNDGTDYFFHCAACDIIFPVRDWHSKQDEPRHLVSHERRTILTR